MKRPPSLNKTCSFNKALQRDSNTELTQMTNITARVLLKVKNKNRGFNPLNTLKH